MRRGRHAVTSLWRRGQKNSTSNGKKIRAQFLSNQATDDNNDPKDKLKALLDPRETEWIPPSRPFAGDRGYAHVYAGENPTVQATVETSDATEQPTATRELQSAEWIPPKELKQYPYFYSGKDPKFAEEEETKKIEGEIDHADLIERPKVKVDPRSMEWTPPNRPLVGDMGHTYMYDQEIPTPSETEELEQIEREIKLLEEEDDLSEEEQLQRIKEELEIIEIAKKKQLKVPAQPDLDWMKLRREALLTPTYGSPQNALEVKHHTLLSATEIMDFLFSLGGINPNFLENQVTNVHGDTRLGGGILGIIFVTGSSTAHIRVLASLLVEQLKLRGLQELGVKGARHGAEGMNDKESTWMCVDCQNYLVNIQDASTRRMLDLEGWWSQADPLAEYKLQGTDDEEALDEFCFRNPVPPDYGRSGPNGWDETIRQLENKRWTAPYRAVGTKMRTGRRRGGTKQIRR